MHCRWRRSFGNLGEQRCVPQRSSGYLPSLPPWGHWLGSLWGLGHLCWICLVGGGGWSLIYLFEVSQQSRPGPLVSIDGWSMTTQAEDWDTKPPPVCGDTRGWDERASPALCHKLAAVPAAEGGCFCQSSACLTPGIPGTSLFRLASLCAVWSFLLPGAYLSFLFLSEGLGQLPASHLSLLRHRLKNPPPLHALGCPGLSLPHQPPAPAETPCPSTGRSGAAAEDQGRGGGGMFRNDVGSPKKG